MLRISNLTSGYSGNEVLHDISLHVAPGEIVGLIGPNGAGKSTVLRSIFQLAQIKRGAITFKKHDVTRLHTHDLLELGIGFVPQGRLVFSNLTVQENLRMGGFLLNNKDVLTRNMNDVLARFPVLREKLRDKARNLSGGQQQMLAIGRALMMTPQLLLLDEPSLGLSPKIMGEIVEILKQLNAAGATLMIVEQNVHLLLEFATRLYVLAAGRVVAEGPPEQFHDPAVLRKLYFQE
ncbi:ABC transporter ATP-binding protein [Candidatus Uhrbacteria bacterium]|nr:ABC transporter ATP-binding protein [Candidatus Uhrbacteria bacterium]